MRNPTGTTNVVAEHTAENSSNKSSTLHRFNLCGHLKTNGGGTDAKAFLCPTDEDPRNPEFSLATHVHALYLFEYTTNAPTTINQCPTLRYLRLRYKVSPYRTDQI